ncbi:isopenicillin N synthase family dioxygenase [Klenkia taihuensis]|uniref:Isopenicillin N synthase n=1 Tax=Klenkia taihuensis TaxID=1225127 RepID=A0A1I1G4G3_9ACTN|nr:2-oxoglutarate and iron-dependent oxygenase domain-containing protein [Klenkia taihuensis]GHE09970.1 2OG-Fe(II) oxygenase [Klenkia taihuensis]SFC06484.1 Isopenicillin N synthase [Klenkia taihuensis]
MTFAVPVVDIAPYVTGTGDRAATAAAMDAACREVGFVQVVGHGVNPALADGLAAAMDAFFALPAGQKAGWRTPPEVNRGYSPPRSESLSLSLGVESASRMNDFFEAFNVGASQASYPHAPGLPQPDYAENTWPDVPGFRAAVEAWFAEASRVARTLTGVFADALHLPPDFFPAMTGHSLDVLRMVNYALPPGTVELDGELTGMGEHTDYGIVTVLWADQVPGLQVLGDDGGWHDVSPVDGALLVNLGDVTTRLTNERWRSTLHRVKPPVVDGTIRRRRSAAFFHDGDVDAVVAVLPSCLGPGEEPKYLPVTVGEHVAAKLRGSRAGVVNTAADREAARVLAARG